MRNGKTIIPNGNTVIETGDKVLIVTNVENYNKSKWRNFYH